MISFGPHKFRLLCCCEWSEKKFEQAKQNKVGAVENVWKIESETRADDKSQLEWFGNGF